MADIQSSFLDLAFKSLNCAVILTDSNGKIVYATEKISSYTDFNVADILNKPFCDVFPSLIIRTIPEQHKAISEILKVPSPIKTHAVACIENHNIWKGGDKKERVISVEASLIQSIGTETAEGVAVIIRDISAKRRIEEKLLQAKKAEYLNVLTAGLAHEFNNRLAVILGNLILAKDISQYDPDLKRYLVQAQQAANQLAELICQLVTFSSGGEPILQPMVLTDFVRKTLVYALHNRDVPSEFSSDDNLWAVAVDIGQLKQAIHHLIGRAIKFKKKDTFVNMMLNNVELQEEGALSIPAGRYVRITILFTGEYISDEKLSTMFDASFSEEKGLNGLDLAAASSIIRRHKGYLFASSDKDGTSRFTIYLPAISIIEQKSVEEPNEILPVAKGRVLVMEDELPLANILSKMLSSLGYQVEVVRNGEEAINNYQKAKERGKPFDIVILDLMVVDGMGGVSTIQRLKMIDQNVLAILSSGYISDPIMRAHFKKYGFNAVLAKPYTRIQLAEVIQSVMSQKKE